MSHKAIWDKLESFGISQFIDPSFPPEDSSIHNKLKTPKFPLAKRPVWKRPSEFMKNPQLFNKGIDPNDINQGLLGDCWFLASIASLAENPALIQRLFITKKYNIQGLYQLKICKNGEWVKVTIDDYFPWYPNGGPMFTQGTGDEIWVLLLEKAYAKLHGNYWEIKGGQTYHGMSDLSGCPSVSWYFPKNVATDTKFKNKLWDMMAKADKRNWIMWGSTPGVDKWTEKGGSNKDSGIVGGHAYSIIGVRDVHGHKLLNIRNPWGKFEWGGAWSDNSKEWTKAMKDAIKPDFNKKDGSFWMSYQDFLKWYIGIAICKVDNWYEARMRGVFMKRIDQNKEDCVHSKFFYSFKLPTKATVHIGLHQEDLRILGSDRRRQIEMQILVIK